MVSYVGKWEKNQNPALPNRNNSKQFKQLKQVQEVKQSINQFTYILLSSTERKAAYLSSKDLIN